MLETVLSHLKNTIMVENIPFHLYTDKITIRTRLVSMVWCVILITTIVYGEYICAILEASN